MGQRSKLSGSLALKDFARKSFCVPITFVYADLI